MAAPSSQALEELPTRSDFASQIDSTFLIGPEPGSGVEAVLVRLDESVITDEQENYSLLFRTPADSGLVQGLYNVENEVIGSTLLFLVPVKQDSQGLFLEAVINRLIKG
jgi:hypothetical protein